MIRPLSNGQFRLVAKTKDKRGRHKNLGTFPSRSAAERRERQVQYFKHKKGKAA